ncbi:MAG: NADH-quinone oxidoreductase subunit C [Solirubrobacteraceae bacterium]|nr:NADH-quinone oxidoreductase subunit C [Solirubrobacteraceae bacterium]
MTARPDGASGPRSAAAITRVAPAGWRPACLRAHADGARFAGLFGAPRGGRAVELRAVFSTPAGERVIACETPERAVESVVDVLPAAAWDEREAHDLHGVRFVGHEPLRPLLDHDAALERWTVPVAGRDAHQVAVGPVHAGVIESGHFRFHVVGELILSLDLRLFYKRRGLEAAATGRPAEDAIAYAQRACAACAVTSSVACAQACEAALGLAPDDELRRARTVLLELERVYNHLHDISAICAGVGFAPGAAAYAALKERVQRLNLRLAGHRFLFGSVRLGGSDLAPAAADVADARAQLRTTGDEHAALWRQLHFSRSLQERLDAVGVLGRDDAERLGAVGPAARAAGLRRDVRSESTRLCYGGFAPVTPAVPAGDVASRMTQRAIELEQSLAVLDELLADPPAPGRTRAIGPTAAVAVGRVESPRGATTCLVELDGRRLRALHLRTGSYANWPSLVHAVPGSLLADFPLINKSFELCYACVDR